MAFADGINAYEASAYATAPSALARVPYEFFVLGRALGLSGPDRPAPGAGDTMAVGDYLARQFGGGGGSELQNLGFLQYLNAELTARGDAHAATDATAIFNDARWIDDTTAPTTVPGPAPFTAARTRPASGGRRIRRRHHPGQYRPADRHRPDAGQPGAGQPVRAGEGIGGAHRGPEDHPEDRDITAVLAHGGSNAVVVAPWRSADHHALLWGAPQEGFGTPSVDGEEYLHGPGYDAGGMYITGEPFILIGRNAAIAFTTTSEETVDQRIYVEQVNYATSPPTYLFNGKWIPMRAIKEQIDVAGEAPQPFIVYRTIDGPVFSAIPQAGQLFAQVRVLEPGDLVVARFSQLGGDTNLRQFRHSMSLITTLHNFFYADRRGNIAYFGDGLVPVEPSFTKVDPRLPALGNGTEQWLGYVPFRDMPHSADPAQGFLDNWNTKPSAAAFYQQNEGDEYWGTNFRSSASASW